MKVSGFEVNIPTLEGYVSDQQFGELILENWLMDAVDTVQNGGLWVTFESWLTMSSHSTLIGAYRRHCEALINKP